jgi:hypothetical protein
MLPSTSPAAASANRCKFIVSDEERVDELERAIFAERIKRMLARMHGELRGDLCQYHVHVETDGVLLGIDPLTW